MTHLRACLELATAMAIVGSSVVVGKLVVARVPVVLVGGLRLAFACLVLLPALFVVERGRPRLGARDLGVLGLQAFAGIFAFSLLLLGGLTLTSAAAAGIVTSTTPAVTAVLSTLILGERLTRAGGTGVGLVVLGVLVINVARPAADAGAGANPLLGNLLVFGAVLGEGLFIIFGRVAAARVPPLTAATTITVLGLLMFVPFAAWEMRRFDLAGVSLGDWTAIAYYGLVVTVVAFVLWMRGLAVVPASTAAGFTAVLPVSAVVLSSVVLGEPIGRSYMVGAACVIAGIVLLARARAQAPTSIRSRPRMRVPDRWP